MFGTIQVPDTELDDWEEVLVQDMEKLLEEVTKVVYREVGECLEDSKEDSQASKGDSLREDSVPIGSII